MSSKKKPVQFRVDKATKRAIRTVASRNDMSMAEFSKKAVLDALEGEPVPDVDGDGGDLEPEPLEEYIRAEVQVETSAEPVPKQLLYDHYRNWCEDHCPRHDVESQHKFTREINALGGVEQGREYYREYKDGGCQLRSFYNVSLRSDLEG